MTNEQVARLLREMAGRRGDDDFAVTDEEFRALAIAAERLSAEPEAPRCEDRIFGLQCVKPQGHDGPHVSEPTDGPADTSARPAGRVRRLSVDVAYDDGTSGLLTMKPRESEGRRLLGVLRQLAFDSPPNRRGES